MTSVLVVDDDGTFRAAVVRLLTQQGLADVSSASGVDEALTTLVRSPVDVLLTDLRLGERDGIDLIEQVRELAPDTRCILMSAYATARDVQTAFELGSVTVLAKPFSPDELGDAIRQAIECGTGFRGNVHGIALTDMLQLLNLSRRSLCIRVTGEVSGEIHLRDGQVVHALAGGVVGKPALQRLLAAGAGSVRTGALPRDGPQTVAGGLAELLLECLTTLDRERMQPGSGPAERRTTVSNVNEVLARIMTTDGAIGCCVADSVSGMMLGSMGDGLLDLDVAAAANSEVVRSKRQALATLGIADEIEDILITLRTQYHLIRPLASNGAFFLYLALDRSKGNLGMARHVLAGAEKGLDLP